jgi:hypothetical protein
MTLRDRCEALVREWRADSADYPIDMADCADALQAALDATEGEGRDAAEDAIDTLLNRLDGWDKAYPTDIFREVSDEEVNWLHTTKPGLCDRISAGMGRHIAKRIREDLTALRAAIKESKP